MNAIKIIRHARGFVVGKVYANLAHGVRQTLLDCGRAVEIDTPEESVLQTPVVATYEEPRVQVAEPVRDTHEETRRRRGR